MNGLAAIEWPLRHVTHMHKERKTGQLTTGHTTEYGMCDRDHHYGMCGIDDITISSHYNTDILTYGP